MNYWNGFSKLFSGCLIRVSGKILSSLLIVISADHLFGISAVPEDRGGTFRRKAVVNMSGK